LKKLLEKQNYRCAYSSELLLIGHPDSSIDHKIPRARGGTNDIDNLQWVAKRINQMKTDFTHEEFLEMCERIATQCQKKPDQSPTESALKLQPKFADSPKSMAA
jgi:5-methylcytosine-specific restriction endonuclease McrA